METFIQSKIPFPISLVQRIEYGCLKKGFSVKMPQNVKIAKTVTIIP